VTTPVAPAAPGTYPVVEHPRVPIARKNSTTYIARCHHCDWDRDSGIRAELAEQTAYHRHLHRTGQIPTT